MSANVNDTWSPGQSTSCDVVREKPKPPFSYVVPGVLLHASGVGVGTGVLVGVGTGVLVGVAATVVGVGVAVTTTVVGVLVEATVPVAVGVAVETGTVPVTVGLGVKPAVVDVAVGCGVFVGFCVPVETAVTVLVGGEVALVEGEAIALAVGHPCDRVPPDIGFADAPEALSAATFAICMR